MCGSPGCLRLLLLSGHSVLIAFIRCVLYFLGFGQVVYLEWIGGVFICACARLGRSDAARTGISISDLLLPCAKRSVIWMKRERRVGGRFFLFLCISIPAENAANTTFHSFCQCQNARITNFSQIYFDFPFPHRHSSLSLGFHPSPPGPPSADLEYRSPKP